MRVILILTALSLSAQDIALDTTPDDRELLIKADRDRLAAQVYEMDLISKLESKYNCKLDLRTAHCQKVEGKK